MTDCLIPLFLDDWISTKADQPLPREGADLIETLMDYSNDFGGK